MKTKMEVTLGSVKIIFSDKRFMKADFEAAVRTIRLISNMPKEEIEAEPVVYLDH